MVEVDTPREAGAAERAVLGVGPGARVRDRVAASIERARGWSRDRRGRRAVRVTVRTASLLVDGAEAVRDSGSETSAVVRGL